MPSTGHQSRARVLTPELKRGDQLPDLAIEVSSELGPVDVSDASRVRVLGQRDGQVVIDRDASGGSDGVVTMQWELSDVTAGVVGFEVEVTWTGVSLVPDPDHPGLYLVPPGMTGAGGLYDPGQLPGSGLYPTVAGGARRRTFPSRGLVWVQIHPDITADALVESPLGSGLYLPGPVPAAGGGLYMTSLLTEIPAGSGLYALTYSGG